MSVNYLRFIPADPAYDPPLAGDRQAKQLLASFVPNSTEITSQRYDTIQLWMLAPTGNSFIAPDAEPS